MKESDRSIPARGKGGRLAIIPLVLLSCLVAGAVWLDGCSSSDKPDSPVLARVEVPEYLEDLNLPVYADLEDGNEAYYALVVATRSELLKERVSFSVIDEYLPGRRYLIALEEQDGARQEAAQRCRVLYDDGQHIIVRYTAALTELLPGLGFDLALMSDEPINDPVVGLFDRSARDAPPKRSSAAPAVPVSRDPLVGKMLTAVTEADVGSYLEALSGETPVTVEGAFYTFTTRHTKSGEPIRKATQYVYERLTAMGLNPGFENWTFTDDEETLSNRNVWAEIRGRTTPDRIIILIAHLDSISNDGTGLAPGADDNASSCASLLAIADVMKNYRFHSTVRFVFTTGEEQSIHGARAHAEGAAKLQQDIVAVINLDMVGYSKKTDPPSRPKQQVKTRNQKNRTGYQKDVVIADTYVTVVETYGLDAVFEAVVEDDGELASDHAPFWQKKYAAVWVIEYAERGYLNPEMHTEEDRMKILNMPYCVAIARASLGTAAHLAGVID